MKTLPSWRESAAPASQQPAQQAATSAATQPVKAVAIEENHAPAKSTAYVLPTATPAHHSAAMEIEPEKALGWLINGNKRYRKIFCAKMAKAAKTSSNCEGTKAAHHCAFMQ